MAVFVDGCFWHGCPDHGHRPTANGYYWNAKIDRNVARDQRNTRILEEAGWLVIRTWEHEAPEKAADLIARALHTRRASERGAA